MPRLTPTVALLAAAPAALATPTFFVEPGVNANGDLAFRAALTGTIDEFDYETNIPFDTLDLSDGNSADVNLLDNTLTQVSGDAFTFFSGVFNVPDAVFQTALLNQGSSGATGSAMEFVFSEPVGGFGTFVFDDGGDSTFRLLVTEVGGAETVSPELDSGSFFVPEGFLGVTSDVGIERVVLQNLNGGEPLADFFEIDHTQIGLVVPAPSAVALLVAGGLILRRRR